MRQKRTFFQFTRRLHRHQDQLRRIVACGMVIACILPMCSAGITASAEDGLCEHHPVHTDACGYRESAEGKSCAHVHNDTCGYTQSGGEASCNHVHDASCGYVEADAGSPCGFVCDICGVDAGSADAGTDGGTETGSGSGTEPGSGTGAGDGTNGNAGTGTSGQPGTAGDGSGTSGRPGTENGADGNAGAGNGAGSETSGQPGTAGSGNGAGEQSGDAGNGSGEQSGSAGNGAGADAGNAPDGGTEADAGETDEDTPDDDDRDPAMTVTAWGWESEYLVLDEMTGFWGLGLPGADEENPVTRDVLAEMLPVEILATMADGSEEVLQLTWDYGELEKNATFEEEGVYEGSYTLTAGLPEGYVLDDGVQELAVVLEVGGGEVLAEVPHEPGRDKYVNGWNYVSSIVKGDDTTGYKYSIDYYLSLNADRDEIKRKLRSALPIEIYGYGNNTDGLLVAAGFRPEGDDPNPLGSTVYGYVKLNWVNVDSAIDSVGSITEGTKFIFEAQTVSNGNYRLRVNSNDVALAGTDSLEDSSILSITVTVHEIHLEDHIVPGINPPNTTVNLFDYCVDNDGSDPTQNDLLGTTDYHRDAARNGVNDWNHGINIGRLLLFGDGNIHAGYWNKGAGAMSAYGKDNAGTPGIVKSVLEQGYPVISDDLLTGMRASVAGFDGISDHDLCGDHVDGNPTSVNPQNISNTVINAWKAADNRASLDYLFDPAIEVKVNEGSGEKTCKYSYTNVGNLFQIDSNGYYYYDMRQNFAEYDKAQNRFILYDAPAVDRTDSSYENGGFTGGRSIGNFLPFNTGSQVFDQVENGKLGSNQNISSNNIETTAGYVNHHLGMTVEIDFRQTPGGMITTGSSGNVPMTFQFSGDDDVWIFIDDVLVLDLGGIHSEIYGTIDFSDGTIRVGQSWKTNGFPYNANGTVNLVELYKSEVPNERTTLRAQFQKAGKEDTVLWSGNSDTFASNTSHTLKMFYLERGNYDSSLALRFNLQSMLYQQLSKVDQDGKPLAGVEFDLYEAEETTAGTAGAIECRYTDNNVHAGSDFYVRQSSGNALVHMTTTAEETTRFIDANGNYFNFADRGSGYYILKETRTPDGYRALPIDVVLYYDPVTSMLSVANRWSTGAYACSVVNVAGTGQLTYGHYDAASGTIETSLTEVKRDTQRGGLAVAVPLLLRKSDHTWEAMYGSNMNGFDVIHIGAGASDTEWRHAVLRAVLQQAADDDLPDWMLSWDEDNLRLSGVLNDLPGLANRYQFNDSSGDMRMAYGIIDPEALRQLGITGQTSVDYYEALGRYVREHGIDAALNVIEGVSTTQTGSGTGFSFLNAIQFNRDFRSLIYIPNDRRELWVMKIDQDGQPRNGTRFGLFDNPDCTGTPVADGVTATVNGQEGTLIFSPSDDQSPGHAKIMWATLARSHYYLKEITAPDDCRLTQTIVPVVVGSRSIYADAGTKTDGVSVMAGVGRLTQTMRQYAMDGDVDITLQDITAFAQSQPSSNTDVLNEDWQDIVLEGTGITRSLNLHFGKNAVVDYGLHDEDGGQMYRPFFVTDTGFIRARVEQNHAALTGAVYGEANMDANKDDLGDTDITNLFSLLNVVVVTDQTRRDTNTGKLLVGKTISGQNLETADYTKNFRFTIRLTDADGQELTGEYYFYGTDKSGYIASGREFPLHHDEEITILGLPAGATYTVTEIAPQDPQNPKNWYPLPESGQTEGEIIKDATAFAPFFNSTEPWPDASFLILHKVVTRGGDRTKGFTFDVTFTDADGNPLTGRFPYTGDQSGSIASGESVTLSHDEHILIRDLPAGTHFAVTEQEAGQDGYTTTYHGETGEAGIRELYTASFINDMAWNDPEEPEDPNNPDNPGNPADPGNPGGDGTTSGNPGGGTTPVVYGEVTGAGQGEAAASSADTKDVIAPVLPWLAGVMVLSGTGLLFFGGRSWYRRRRSHRR